MDQSIIRSGKLCWYKLENVGLMSINDAILIEQEIYHILRLFFSNKKYYHYLIDLLHETTRLTSFGQCLDMNSNPPNRTPQLERFTRLRYNSICKLKTAFMYAMPIKLAMHVLSYDSTDELKCVDNIFLKIGILLQELDDYLDCFGDPAITGAIGTDIEEGKCCWPIVKTLELCSAKQFETLKQNYGIKSIKSVKTVKDIYNELNLKELFTKEHELHYKQICDDIDILSYRSKLSPKIFKEYLEKIKISKNYIDND